jgi:hypothetical protein
MLSVLCVFLLNPSKGKVENLSNRLENVAIDSYSHKKDNSHNKSRQQQQQKRNDQERTREANKGRNWSILCCSPVLLFIDWLSPVKSIISSLSIITSESLSESTVCSDYPGL